MPNPLTTELAQLPAALLWTAQRNIGVGFYHALLIPALLYCLILGRRSGRGAGRLQTLGMASLLLLLGWPLVVWLGLHFGFHRQYYPRFGWFLMVELLLAAVGADLARRQRSGWPKRAALVAVVAALVLCGQPLFTERFYQPSNPYKIQDETIALADHLAANHPGALCYFTEEISVEIRQYDASVLMASPRGTRWFLEKTLYRDQWRKAAPAWIDSWEKRWKRLDVIVFKHVEELEEKMRQLGWRVEKRIGRYDVYSRVKES